MGGWGGAPHLSDISAALVPPPEPGMVAGKSGRGRGGGGPVGGGLGLYPSTWFPPWPPLSWTWDCPPKGPSVGPGPWSEFSAHPPLSSPALTLSSQVLSGVPPFGARTSPSAPTPPLVSLPSTQLSSPLPNSPRSPLPLCPRPTTPVHQYQCLLLDKPHERPCRLGAGLGTPQEGLDFSENSSPAPDFLGAGWGVVTGCVRNLGCLSHPGIGVRS